MAKAKKPVKKPAAKKPAVKNPRGTRVTGGKIVWIDRVSELQGWERGESIECAADESINE